MRNLSWRRVIALVLMVMVLQSSAAAQGIGGDYKEGDDDSEGQTSESNGPCFSENTDDVIDPEEAGLVGNRDYQSPQFGYEVEWSRDWMLDDYFETPVLSAPDDELDALCLFWSEGNEDYAYVYIVGQTASRGGPDADVEEWLDPDYIDEQWNPSLYDVTPLLDDTSRDMGGVMYQMEDLETGARFYTTYISIEMVDESVIYLTFVANETGLENAYTAVADIELDGEAVFTMFDWDDIEAEL